MPCSRLTALMALFVSLFLCGLNTEVTIAPIIVIYLPSDVWEYFCWCIFVPGQLRLTALHLVCISTYHIITYLKALWRWSCSYCVKNRKRPFTYFLFKYRVRQSSSKERANRKLESRFAPACVSTLWPAVLQDRLCGLWSKHIFIRVGTSGIARG